ncbi:DUF4406 domain-containing protein [Brevibacillus brevis]|uniref:DUF4406 domain-containing protein n=1 Tax=Brevibacillus brevis TaxID=1393 RepID=A0ABY9T3X6_BREBE|nr:DUF4406 domain-containing protein [Brevibacillus brevis]WNC13123.1 DUF4406 domain-containing protein [Brevibacillus brevis]
MENQRIGVCSVCDEPIHYKYPCRCRREKPRVITLCGSTRFKREFEEVNKNLTLQGNLVISVGVFGHSEGIQLSEQEKQMLDNIHLRKIDMADEIYVINFGGYIGSSTKNEIEYAKATGKEIRYHDEKAVN